MPPTDSPSGISAALLQRSSAALLRCPTLQSQAELEALFADARLAPWKYRIQQVGTVAGRVELVINQLHDQWTVGSENALVLLLRVLSDCTQPGDGLREELAALAVALAGGDVGAMLPQDPEARLAALPTDRVPEVARSLPPDAIFILSAKHGLMSLDQEIAPYNLTLNTMGVKERSAWTEQVRQQLASVADLQNDTFIFLAGERYRQGLLPLLNHYEIPMEDLPIGRQLQFLTERLGR